VPEGTTNVHELPFLSRQCRNRGGFISHCEFIETNATEEDDSLAPARVLNLSPPPRGEKKKSKTTNDTFPDDSETTAEEADGLRRTVDFGGSNQFEGNEEEEDTPDHNIRDLEGATISNVDFWMDQVYVDHIHQNSGHRLDGDISDDTE
jgi:hypothetical protein